MGDRADDRKTLALGGYTWRRGVGLVIGSALLCSAARPGCTLPVSLIPDSENSNLNSDDGGIGGGPPRAPRLSARLFVDAEEAAAFSITDARSQVLSGEIANPATGAPDGAFRMLLRRVDAGELAQIGIVVDDAATLDGRALDVSSLAGLFQVIVPRQAAEVVALTSGASGAFPDAVANAMATGTLTLALSGSGLTGHFDFTLADDAGFRTQAIGDCIDVPPTFEQPGDFDGATPPEFPVSSGP